VRAGEQLALSVGNIGVLAGTPAGFNVVITNEDKNTWLTNSAKLTADNRNAVFSVHTDIVAQKALLLIYAGPTGATSGNIVRFDQIMLVRGNKPALSWSPSIADQEKYTDDKVGGIQIGSVNLLDGSREFTVTAGSGNNYKFQVFDIGEVEAGEVFALSVENISVLAGTPGELSVRMYNEGASKDLANYVEISAEERTALFTIKRRRYEAESQSAFLCRKIRRNGRKLGSVRRRSTRPRKQARTILVSLYRRPGEIRRRDRRPSRERRGDPDRRLEARSEHLLSRNDRTEQHCPVENHRPREI